MAIPIRNPLQFFSGVIVSGTSGLPTPMLIKNTIAGILATSITGSQIFTAGMATSNNPWRKASFDAPIIGDDDIEEEWYFSRGDATPVGVYANDPDTGLHGDASIKIAIRAVTGTAPASNHQVRLGVITDQVFIAAPSATFSYQKEPADLKTTDRTAMNIELTGDYNYYALGNEYEFCFWARNQTSNNVIGCAFGAARRDVPDELGGIARLYADINLEATYNLFEPFYEEIKQAFESAGQLGLVEELLNLFEDATGVNVDLVKLDTYENFLRSIGGLPVTIQLDREIRANVMPGQMMHFVNDRGWSDSQPDIGVNVTGAIGHILLGATIDPPAGNPGIPMPVGVMVMQMAADDIIAKKKLTKGALVGINPSPTYAVCWNNAAFDNVIMNLTPNPRARSAGVIHTAFRTEMRPNPQFWNQDHNNPTQGDNLFKGAPLILLDTQSGTVSGIPSIAGMFTHLNASQSFGDRYLVNFDSGSSGGYFIIPECKDILGGTAPDEYVLCPGPGVPSGSYT